MLVCNRSTLTSPIVTLIVGHDQRLFAAHEDVLSISPFFTAALKAQFYESASKKVELPNEYVLNHYSYRLSNKSAENPRSFPAS